LLTLCPQCDLAQRLDGLAAGARARCARCGAELGSGLHERRDDLFAFLATAAVLVLVMNAFPLVELRSQGAAHATTLLGAVLELRQRGMTALALLVAGTTILGPVAEIGFLTVLLMPDRLRLLEPARARIVGFLQQVRPWSMVEVFMLGVLVAIVKLAALADIVPGPALWACATLIVVLSLLKARVRPEDFWAWSQGRDA
jgi:paraquat-inducible protein A